MNSEMRALVSLIRDHQKRLDKIRKSIGAALNNEIRQLGKTSTSPET